MSRRKDENDQGIGDLMIRSVNNRPNNSSINLAF